MNVIARFWLFLKNKIENKDQIKRIEAPKETGKRSKENDYIRSLKFNIPTYLNQKEIEILTSKEDGLGIHRTIAF